MWDPDQKKAKPVVQIRDKILTSRWSEVVEGQGGISEVLSAPAAGVVWTDMRQAPGAIPVELPVLLWLGTTSTGSRVGVVSGTVRVRARLCDDSASSQPVIGSIITRSKLVAETGLRGRGGTAHSRVPVAKRYRGVWVVPWDLGDLAAQASGQGVGSTRRTGTDGACATGIQSP